MQHKLSDVFGKTPFIRLTIPFLLGIIAGEYIFRHSFSFIWLVGIAGLVYLLLYFSQGVVTYKYRWIWGVLASLFLFFCGVTLWQQQKRTSELPSDETIMLNAVIAEHPVRKPNSLRLCLAVDAYRQDNVWIKSSENVVVYLQIDSTEQVQLRAGQRVLIPASLQSIKPPSNPEEFDYRSYMQRRGYYATAFIRGSSFEVLEDDVLPFYRAVPLSIQRGLLSCFEKADIEGQELAALMALTIGDKQLLDNEVKRAYSSAGVIHILAVSGLHVGLLYMLLTYFLFFLKGKKYKLFLKSAIILFCLWLYVAIAGFSPSVTRAVVMFSFILLARLSGRQASTLNAVFASAFFICLFKPLSIFDVGFQLSYFAVLGILAFYPKLNKLITVKNPILKGAWNICCVSFSAQLAVLPFSVFYFHQIPTYFLLANIIVLPLVAVATCLIVILLLISFIPFVSTFIGFLLSLCVYCINYVVAAIRQLPFAVWDGIYLSPFQLMLSLVALLCLMLLMAYRKKALTWTAIACAVLTLLLGITHYVEAGRQHRLVVFNVGYSSLITFIDGRAAICIKDDRSSEKSFEYNTDGYFVKQYIDRKNVQTFIHSELESFNSASGLYYHKDLFWFHGYSIKLIAKHDNLLKLREPLSIDVLAISNSSRLLPEEVLKCCIPKLVVIDSSVSARKMERWISTLNQNNIPYYSVKQSGAFILVI
ncbi:MAG: ComEC family competence protein [Prevotellaceae bacterium]|jgi:competence protein ComEC|nr:ComEC family competence protein [Prevotellaceae bacterium]